MRKLQLGVVLCVLFSLLPPRLASRAATPTCASDLGIPGACRIYIFDDRTSKLFPPQLDFVAYTAANESEADAIFNKIRDQISGNKMTVDIQLPGDRHETFCTSDDNWGSACHFIFRSGRVVSEWISHGLLADILEGQVLTQIYAQLGPRKSNGPTGRTLEFIPSLNRLPAGYSLVIQQYLGGVQGFELNPQPTPDNHSESTATPDLQATIAVLQTRVGGLESQPTPTASPTKTATATPTKTATPLPTATPTVVAAVATYVSEDSPTDCDRIGWGLPNANTDNIKSDDLIHYVSCTSFGVFLMYCGTVTAGMISSFIEPGPNEQWVICVARIANVGNETITASMSEFALVDANGARYSASFVPLTAALENALQFESIPPDQYIEKAIAFVTPQNLSRPARIEVMPLFDSTNARSAVIILDRLMPVNVP